MLTLVVAIKGLVELMATLILARALVRLVSFGRHQSNPVYRVLGLATSPVLRLARRLSPGVIVDQHVPAVALLLLAVIWVFLGFAKLQLIASGPV